MELVATMPKPQGFFDPKAPAGIADAAADRSRRPRRRRGGGSAPRERPPAPRRDDDARDAATAARPPAQPPTRPRTEPGARRAAAATARQGLNFANSDLAFRRADMFLGNFNGFNTYDIETPKKPRLLASVVCPGGQGDMSVHGNLLFMSVEQTRGRVDCGTQGVTETVERRALPRRPHLRHQRHLEAEADRRDPDAAAARTRTRWWSIPNDKANIYVYGSGTGAVRSGEELAGCSSKAPDEDPNTALFSIDVIKVPLAAPEKAAIVNRPRIFADPKTGAIAGLWQGGSHGAGHADVAASRTSATTSRCSRTSASRPAPAPATASCSTSPIR